MTAMKHHLSETTHARETASYLAQLAGERLGEIERLQLEKEAMRGQLELLRNQLADIRATRGPAKISPMEDADE